MMDIMQQFDFGSAIAALKAGRNVARAGWNGKRMYIYMMKGQACGPELGFADPTELKDGVPLGLFRTRESGKTRLPCICMRTATGSHLYGWLASQTDMLAEDWEEVG